MKRAGSVDQPNSAEFNSVLKEAHKISLFDLLKDAHIRKAFEKFNSSQVSSTSLTAVALVISVASAMQLLRYMAYVKSSPARTMLISATAMVGLNALLTILLWTVTYLRFRKTGNSDSWIVHQLKRYQPLMHVMLPIGLSAMYGFHLILRVIGARCPDDALYADLLMCNPNNDTNGLPEETVAQLMLLPIIFHIVLRDSMFGTFLISWLVSLGSIMAAGFLLNIRQTTPFLCLYFAYSIIILYDNQRQNVSLFFVAEKLKFTLDENNRLADETHASELRHMIANVAHDLKTPLTSFLSGIEFISQIVVDWDEHICDPAKYPHALSDVGYSSENLNAIHGCLDSIRNTNSFMIMTINRCIDFTKASKGLKLIPKLETIELQETIDLPIKVMRDFKSNLTINLLPIAGDICTHIISDRQWLQENLLCLMSNAVKYSSKGKVEISVKLVTMPIVQRAVPESVPKSANSPKRPKNSFKVLPGAGAVAGSISAGSGEVAESYSSRSRGYEEGGVGTSNRETRTTDPDSTKIRKLSNFVFNHAYSNIGRSRVFSEKILSDIDKERDSGDDVINYAAIEEGEGGVDEDERADSSTKEEGESGQFLRIEVEDTGIGLSEEAMQTLFNPFKQAQRLAGGTGLGLYSLAKRIEALSGHYGVSHRRDQNPGSLFWFAIPYRPDTAFAQSIQLKQHKNHLARASSSRVFMNHAGRSLSNRMANAGHAAHGGAGGDELIDLEGPGPSLTIKSSSSNSVHTDIDRSSSGVLRPTSGRSHTDSMSIAPEGDSDAPKAPKLNILLVDDSLSILKMTAMMLRRSGHKVEQADNGAAGLELILQGYEKKRPLSPGTNDTPYDVVLMDLQMPIMDGLEAVRRLRAAEKTLHKKSPELSVQDLDDEGKSDERGTMRGFFFGRNSNKRIVVSPENASSPRTGERRRSSIALKHQLVIGVSANSDNDTMVEAMKSGFDAFIGKPFSIDAFYEVLQTQQDKFRERNSTAGGAQKK